MNSLYVVWMEIWSFIKGKAVCSSNSKSFKTRAIQYLLSPHYQIANQSITFNYMYLPIFHKAQSTAAIGVPL